MNERDYPHLVEMMVPLSPGFGSRLNVMHNWHHARGMGIYSGRGRREEIGGEMRWYIRWCFADAATADAFKAEFGGERVQT